MIIRQDGDETMLRETPNIQRSALAVVEVSEDTDVDFALPQRVELGARRKVEEADLRGRMALLELADDRRNKVVEER